jgi:hypothetical protein
MPPFIRPERSPAMVQPFGSIFLVFGRTNGGRADIASKIEVFLFDLRGLSFYNSASILGTG